MSRKMPAIFSGSLLIAVLLATGYFGVQALSKNPCDTPKTWSMGAVDPRFGISPETAKKYAQESASIWNKAYSKNQLLTYKDTGGDIIVTFVYDDRQRTTIQNEKLEQAIATDKGELTGLKQTLEVLKEQYSTLGAKITSETSDYQNDLNSFNSEVSNWNAQGGAPEREYARLMDEQKSLEQRRESINTDIARYNDLAKEITTYGENHNEIVTSINDKIETLNQSATRDFEEGTFDPGTDRITIYEYDTAVSLSRVLTHEFGHAIGLMHVADKNAIMYSVNSAKTTTLSQGDKDELARVCAQKNPQSVLSMLKTTRDDIVRRVVSSWHDIAALKG